MSQSAKVDNRKRKIKWNIVSHELLFCLHKGANPWALDCCQIQISTLQSKNCQESQHKRRNQKKKTCKIVFIWRRIKMWRKILNKTEKTLSDGGKKARKKLKQKWKQINGHGLHDQRAIKRISNEKWNYTERKLSHMWLCTLHSTTITTTKNRRTKQKRFLSWGNKYTLVPKAVSIRFDSVYMFVSVCVRWILFVRRFFLFVSSIFFCSLRCFIDIVSFYMHQMVHAVPATVLFSIFYMCMQCVFIFIYGKRTSAQAHLARTQKTRLLFVVLCVYTWGWITRVKFIFYCKSDKQCVSNGKL